MFVKRAFGDNNNQFQAWIEDVNKNSSTAPSTNISTTPSTPIIASIEKSKKKMTLFFEVQSLQSRIAQIVEQARSSAVPDIAYFADNSHSSAVPNDAPFAA